MRKYKLSVNGNPYEVEIRLMKDGKLSVVVNGIDYKVEVERFKHQEPPDEAFNNLKVSKSSESSQAELLGGIKPHISSDQNKGEVIAPMPGTIVEVKVKVGDKVKVGENVLKIEAMKMESEIPTTVEGVIEEVRVYPGTQVQTGDVLMVIGS